ncbi:MAG: hypothetical protein JKY29_00480 [Gammaproteobacteria bacterium]|nr:hypothetical protein [Gammaproteobacteria bacterium]MBL4728959.1 hypothetical protein [Gammaproteobacteria bacterium]
MDTVEIDQQGLHELLFISIEHIDTAFNYWVSVTFALIIAAHFVGRNLNARETYTLVGLYAGFCIVYAGRIVFSGLMASKYTEAINVLVPPGYMNLLGIMRYPVFIFGSFAAAYFLIKTEKEK